MGNFTLLPCKQNPSFTNSLTVNDAEIVDPKEISEQFNTLFVNIAKDLTKKLKYTDDTTFISNLQQSSPSSINLNPTNVYEIVNLINSLQINKASGFNDISPYFLKIGADILAYPLVDLFNYCLSFGIFPQQLKIAKVISIYNSGLLDNVGNYRPISLLTSLSKICERLLHKRLVSFFKKNNTLVLTQFGFRHHYSTLHSILDIITNCYDCVQGKKFVNLIFLDIKKNFDSVSHYTVNY